MVGAEAPLQVAKKLLEQRDHVSDPARFPLGSVSKWWGGLVARPHECLSHWLMTAMWMVAW